MPPSGKLMGMRLRSFLLAKPALSILSFLFCLASASFADTNYTKFCECDGWTRWSPRDGIAPSFSIVAEEGRSHDNALKLETKNRSEFGAWKITLQDLKPNQAYRFIAWYKVRNVPHERRSVAPRVEWFDANEKSLR